MTESVAPRFSIHAATPADLDAVLALARHLNTVNLPHDRDTVQELLELSEASFAGRIRDPAARHYLFVLQDRQHQRVVGTSMLIAQLGRRGVPYIYLDVGQVEKYSATLDRHFVHTMLTTRYSYDGPTEIGGLVVHPDFRRGPGRCGTLISFVRLLFLAMRPQDFQGQVLAELMPPLTPDGTSHLWEALGRRFTGLSYSEADRLSKTNKEFIRGLFPVGEICATLLSEQARSVIGEVGEATRGVERMLSRIGFQYAHRVDPFDGGPHFVAPLQAISVVRHAGDTQLVADDEPLDSIPYLVARRLEHPPYFVACAAEGERETGALRTSSDLVSWFDVHGPGDTWATPLRAVTAPLSVHPPATF